MSASRSSTPPPRARRLALGMLLGFLVIGAVFWHLRADSGSDGPLDASAPPATPSGPAEPAPAFAHGLSAPQVAPSALDTTPDRVALATPPQLVMERPRIIYGGDRIEGVLYVSPVESRNDEQLAQRATFVLDVTIGASVQTFEVEVVRGVWSCQLPVALRKVSRVAARDARVEGRPCESEVTIAPASWGADVPSSFAARSWCASEATVELVDALTRVPLRTALVLPATDPLNLVPTLDVQESDPPVREAPLDLAAFARSTSEQAFFVSSPGYGWRRIVVDLRRATFQRVELAPAGELRLTGTPDSGLLELLRLAPDGSTEKLAAFSRKRLPFRFTGLPAGEYELRSVPEAAAPTWLEPDAQLRRLTREELERLRICQIHPLLEESEAPSAPPRPPTPIQLRLTITAGTRTEHALER